MCEELDPVREKYFPVLGIGVKEILGITLQELANVDITQLVLDVSAFVVRGDIVHKESLQPIESTARAFCYALHSARHKADLPHARTLARLTRILLARL